MRISLKNKLTITIEVVKLIQQFSLSHQQDRPKSLCWSRFKKVINEATLNTKSFSSLKRMTQKQFVDMRMKIPRSLQQSKSFGLQLAVSPYSHIQIDPYKWTLFHWSKLFVITGCLEHNSLLGFLPFSSFYVPIMHINLCIYLLLSLSMSMMVCAIPSVFFQLVMNRPFSICGLKIGTKIKVILLFLFVIV